MKTRSGVPESKAFGPAKPIGTEWIITPRNAPIGWLLANPDSAYTLASNGATAFEACARVGMTLGSILDIRPATVRP